MIFLNAKGTIKPKVSNNLLGFFNEFGWSQSSVFFESTEESGAGGKPRHFSNFINGEILCNALQQQTLCVFNSF
jgi:hypothetical protein